MRCLIVDDDAAFLEASRSLLERQGVSVIAVASSPTEGLDLVDETRPDVVLVDIDLGHENGFTLTEQLTRRAGPEVILISTHPEDDFADLVAESSARGFIAKSGLSAAAIEATLDAYAP